MEQSVTSGLVGAAVACAQVAPDEVESLRDFAKRVGRSHPTISEHIGRGNITAVVRDASGRLKGVYWRLALAEYVRNVDPTAAEKTGKVPVSTPSVRGRIGEEGEAYASPSRLETPQAAESRQSPPLGGSAAGLELPPGGEADTEKSYLEHRAKTEKFRSMQAELDYLQALKLLVPVGQFREATFRRYRALRDKLLNIPDRVATVLAAERDPTQVHHKLTEEIRRVLSELSDDARAEVARGVAGRVAA